MQSSTGDNSARTRALARAVQRQIRGAGTLLVAINILLPMLLFGWSRVSQREFWRLFDGEVTAVNWLSSVQLVLLAGLALLNYQALSLLRRVDPARKFRYQGTWLVFAGAFLLLACDERFAYHEWLASNWDPGRYALLLVFAAGAATSLLLLGHLRRRPVALGLYAAGLLLALVAAAISSVDEATRYQWTLWYFWDHSFEETAELWAQALMALAFLRVLHARVGAIGRASCNQPDMAASLVEDARGRVQRFGLAMLALNLLLPAGFAAYAVVTGESFYELFWGERDAISWFSSLQLLAVGCVAWFVHQAEVLARRPPFAAATDPAVRRPALLTKWIWLVFAAGFVFLAIDERFELHEALRDDVMQPAGHLSDVPLIVPGDIGLYVYLAFGLVFAAFLVRELRDHPRALFLFLAAVALSGVIVVEDSLAEPVRNQLPFPGFWDTAFEEIGEIWTQLCFLSSFLVVLSRRLLGLSR